jgi:predicted deacylase
MRLTYKEFERRVKSLRASHGMRVREVAAVGAPRTLLCVELGAADLPVVALSAGVHGDEPAGPAALLDLLESGNLDSRYAYRIWPCTNPTGMDAGTRASGDRLDINRTFGRGGGSPEAKAVIMANRDRKFALSIDLHEDCDAEGFYCYDYGDGSLGRAVVAALDAADLAVAPFDAPYDLGSALPNDAVRFERGTVRADPITEAIAVGGLSYSLLLARNAAAYVLTFETPSSMQWNTRLAMHRIAVGAAIAGLSRAAG